MNGGIQLVPTISGRISGRGTLSGTAASHGTVSGTLAAVGGVTGIVWAVRGLSGALASLGGVSGTLANYQGDVPVYGGAYEFTPGTEEQTIPIANRKATQDIIVHAIPNNYGLITWNGAVLTVS